MYRTIEKWLLGQKKTYFLFKLEKKNYKKTTGNALSKIREIEVVPSMLFSISHTQ